MNDRGEVPRRAVEVSRLKDQNASLRNDVQSARLERDVFGMENDRLRLLLASLEWAPHDDCCPACCEFRRRGHHPDCPLKAALDGR
jgi:hypothetical protein